jgi:hypothetical protein
MGNLLEISSGAVGKNLVLKLVEKWSIITQNPPLF